MDPRKRDKTNWAFILFFNKLIIYNHKSVNVIKCSHNFKVIFKINFLLKIALGFEQLFRLLLAHSAHPQYQVCLHSLVRPGFLGLTRLIPRRLSQLSSISFYRLGRLSLLELFGRRQTLSG